MEAAQEPIRPPHRAPLLWCVPAIAFGYALAEGLGTGDWTGRFLSGQDPLVIFLIAFLLSHILLGVTVRFLSQGQSEEPPPQTGNSPLEDQPNASTKQHSPLRIACSSQRLYVALSLLAGAFVMLGMGWFVVREPLPDPDWKELPPREMSLTVEVERLFRAPAPDRLNGLGKILETPFELTDLKGHRVYFHLNRGNLSLAKVILPGTELKMAGLGSYVASIRAMEEDIRNTLSLDVEGSSQEVREARQKAKSSTAKAGGFTQYLHQQGVALSLRRGVVLQVEREPSAMSRWQGAARQRLEAILRKGQEETYSHGTAGIGVAMLLGQRDALEESAREAFRQTGVMHLFAISGLHVASLALVLNLLLKALRLPEGGRIAVTMGLLALYVWATGMPISAQRAWLMIALWWGSRLLWRPPSSLSALLAAALIELLLHPRSLWDAGFQLSFTATGAILLWGAPVGAHLNQWLRQHLGEGNSYGMMAQMAHYLSGLIVVSVSCFFATLPAMASHFGYVAPVGLLLNLLAVPLATLAVSAGMLSMLAGMAQLEAVNAFFNHGLWLILLVLEGLAESARQLASGVAWTLSPGWPSAGALAGAPLLLAALHPWVVRGRWWAVIGFPVGVLLWLLAFGAAL